VWGNTQTTAMKTTECTIVDFIGRFLLALFTK
jgi:hypothetical protein